MFDFLFKRRGAAASNATSATAATGNRAGSSAKSTAATAATAALDAAARAQARQLQRDQALQAAGQLADEQAALAFVMQCEFADARLAAAQWLTGEAALVTALAAVRNSDRRVAKLLQGRLDTLHRYARAQLQMASAVDQVEALLSDAGLTPGHAAEIDRAWTAAGGDMLPLPLPDTGHAGQHEIALLRNRFETARTALSARLAQQTYLQRELVDMRIYLQKMLDGFAGETSPTEDGAAEVARLGERLAQHRADPEAATLPAQLLPECERLLAACAAVFQRLASQRLASQRLAEEREALAKAADAAAALVSAALAFAEAATAKAVAAAPANAATANIADADADADSARTAGIAIAETANGGPQTAAVESVPAAGKKPAQPARARAPQLSETERLVQLAHWRTALAQLETALEAGMLQAASEAERALRGYDARAIKPAAAETSRLNAAYAGLHHLQGWARWGGNVSREELLQTALALPEQALAVAELAQKIGSLRERWKLLSVSGSAPQALWERFDEACTLAYAPVALQYRQQEQVRQENRTAAELLLSEVQQYLQKSSGPAEEPVLADDEFKAIAKFASRMRQSWQRLGPLGHKEKRGLDRTFADALKTLEAPLRRQQKQEIGARHAMIAEVAALQPDDRNTVDTLRQIQAQWQQHAQSVPLARKDEQALWLAFRTACDAVFAQRKLAAGEQDAQRQVHLQEKETLCAELEAIAADCVAGAEIDGCAAAVRESLRTIKSAWSRIGQVPRAAERGIEQRFARVTDGLQALLQEAQARAAAAAGAAEAVLIEQRLALCFAIEGSVAERGAAAQNAQDWRARWQAGDAAPRAYEQVLSRRFQAVVDAVDTHGGDDYLHQLLQQRATFDDALLASEIVAGLDSPPQLARQRMQLQVALLQASLKAGAASQPSGVQAQLLRLCALPVVADAELRARVSKVVLHAVQA